MEASFTYTLQLTLTYLHYKETGNRKSGNIGFIIDF